MFALMPLLTAVAALLLGDLLAAVAERFHPPD